MFSKDDKDIRLAFSGSIEEDKRIVGSANSESIERLHRVAMQGQSALR